MLNILNLGFYSHINIDQRSNRSSNEPAWCTRTNLLQKLRPGMWLAKDKKKQDNILRHHNSYGSVLHSLYDLFEELKCQLHSCQWWTESSDFIKKIFVCVSKMNESHTCLERHD